MQAVPEKRKGGTGGGEGSDRAGLPIGGGGSWVTGSTGGWQKPWHLAPGSRGSQGEKRARFRAAGLAVLHGRGFQPVPNLNKGNPQHSLAQRFFKIPQRAYSGISIKVSLAFFSLQPECAASQLSTLQQWGMGRGGYEDCRVYCWFF